MTGNSKIDKPHAMKVLPHNLYRNKSITEIKNSEHTMKMVFQTSICHILVHEKSARKTESI